MPNSTGGFHLYYDTSKFAKGNALYQIQNGKPKLIAYTCKGLPERARNCSITELGLCGLAINIASFSHLLKRVNFDTIVDHLALIHIIKSKAEPATARLKRLLEIISSYSFNLYYIKGKDMILSDFLSRQNHNDSNLHEIIPISFNMHNVLHEKYYNIGETDIYLVQTWSQTKSSRVKLPEVHGVSKSLDPNIQHQKQKSLKGNEIVQDKLSKKIPEVSKIEMRIKSQAHSSAPAQSITNSNDEVTHRSPMIKDIPFYPDPTYRPPPKPVRTPMPGSSQSSESTNIDPEINIDFEENSPFQEGIIWKNTKGQTSHSSKNLEN